MDRVIKAAGALGMCPVNAAEMKSKNEIEAAKQRLLR